MNRRLSHWLVMIVACLAMIGLNAFTGEFKNETVSRVNVGQPGRLYDSTITVNSWKVGQVLYNDDRLVGRSAVMWLVINVTVVTDGAERRTSWKAGGLSGDRTFAATGSIVVPDPGFIKTQDLVFELDPNDLPGFTLTVLDRPAIYAFDPQVNIPLGITPQQAADTVAANRYARVKTTELRAEPIR